ncbi:conserved exported hypothetical protein [Candidatus Sulfopaludibacter sp. SbA4]|nr:conserved exported hypothetical protein [Candidatus Sulfopaludibacter sp. SbA4]
MRKFNVYATILMSGMIVPHLIAADCSNADLRGAYSFEASGTYGGVPFAAAGQTIYNGDGTAEGVIQASVGGAVFPVANWTATYSLSPMSIGGGQTVCVLKKEMTIPSYKELQLTFFGSAGADFKELRFIASKSNQASSLTVSGTARKQ